MRLYRNYQNLKENKKSGFTLIELIVVLVILAILAAIMIPSMLGWIDKAREKQIILQARSAYIAAQTVIMEDYAMGEVLEDELTEDQILRAEELAKLEGEIESGMINTDSGEIIDFVYVQGNYKAFYHENEIGIEGRSSTEAAGWNVEKQ